MLAVFITLAVDGEERAYSVRLSVPASWKAKPMSALLRAFVKRANKTEAFSAGPLEEKRLQLEYVKDIGVSLLESKIEVLFESGSRRADLVATARASRSTADLPENVPALSDIKFKNEEERAAALFQFIEILEQVRMNVRRRALDDKVPLAVGATRIDLAMAQAVAAATGVKAELLTSPVTTDSNWYETVHKGVATIVPECFVATRARGVPLFAP